MALRILTLGGLTLEVDGELVTGALTQRRRLAVLLLLGQAGSRGVARERILALFWPEADDRTAGHSLAQLLYAARREMGGPALVLGTKTLRLNPEVLTTDAQEFEAALASGDRAGALALYRGPFADGFHVAGAPGFEEWLDGERERLGRLAAGAALALAEGARAAGDRPAAGGWFRRAVELEPWVGAHAVGLAEVLAEGGDRVGAVRALEAHAARVERELELPPDPAVAEALAALRSGAPTP